MNFWKKCPLLILLLVSGLIISVVSLVNLDGSYREFEKKTVMTPVLAAFFQGIKEEKYPWSDRQEALVMAEGTESEKLAGADGVEPEEELAAKESAQPQETAGENADEIPEGTQEAADTAVETDGEGKKAFAEPRETAEPSEGTEQESVSWSESTEQTQKEQTASRTEEAFETEETGQEAEWQLGRVEEEYFNDALFIGDSRTQGLYEYGGFSENVTFYSKTSLTVYDLFKKNKAFIKEGDRKLTLEEALTEHTFGKIYLMIGINEMGTGTPESFFEEYARTVYRIQQLQPDAVIFLQAIMRVGARKNASDPVFNNMNIAIRNVEIETLADDRRIFYLDVNEVFSDENGNLFEGWSNDQIHLKAKYYAVWKEYLLNHGAVEKG